MTKRRLVTVNGVDLSVETFGDESAPAVLLIAGAAASMDSWDPEFCRRLAGYGRFVIRYDHRDTGGSTSYPPGRPGYSGYDLRNDAYSLVAELARGKAHLVGMSMGGGIAQVMAAEHPDDVLSLTLMSTGPAFAVGPEIELPSMSAELRSAFEHPAPSPDWSDDDAVVDYLVAEERLLSGPRSFDEDEVRARVRRDVARTTSIESAATNHWIVVGGDDGDAGSRSFADLGMPTLIIHGSDDPLFPPGYAAALNHEIPDAELLLLDGVGHQPPPRSTWHLVLPAIAAITSERPSPRRPYTSELPVSAPRNDS